MHYSTISFSDASLLKWKPLWYIIKIYFGKMASKALSKGLNMIMFRGKLTCSPNTLNNEIHTYFFAHRWQRLYTEKQFNYQAEKNRAKYQKIKYEALKATGNAPEQKIVPFDGKYEYSYESWMKLIKDVAEFNRFYIQCYQQAFGESITIMDFRAFRLFHDWDVWGDSTSYPEIKATAVFDSSQQRPLKSIDDLHLSTKMGTNKCVIANMDTDSQDMSKLFAFSLNLNQQLKIHLNPSVTRTLYFRTVDTLPWTPSMGTHWFATGNTELLHGNINPQEIKWPLNILYNKAERLNLTELKMLQYRYNHPTKVSNVVGYLMNTERAGKNQYQFVNYNWRIVKLESSKYDNPSPQKSYNGNTNDHTTVQVFIRNVTYGINGKGILVDLSGAMMDANNSTFLPNFPQYFQLRIFSGTKELASPVINTEKAVADLFHNRAGLLLIENAQIPEGSPITIRIIEVLKSQVVFGKDFEIPVAFSGVEPTYNLQIKDHFLKTPAKKVIEYKEDQLGPDGKKKSVTIYQNYVRYELNYTQYGKGYSGTVSLAIDSQFNIDTSGITQYTSNLEYLKTKGLREPPKVRLQRLIDSSPKFRKVFPKIETIDNLVFQNKLDWIIEFTDKDVLGKLFKNGSLQYTFPDAKGQSVPFKLSFKPDQEVNTIDVKFENGRGFVDVFLNKSLTEQNNPRHPSMQSLCLTGQLKLASSTGKFQANLTALFYQNPRNNPYEKIDWLNVVGPKLKLMGLLYPSMQNIIDLYDYDGLSMSAMKRAFEIEDEQHSRYMPATREMAPTTHRQIRRWLYNPVYDNKVYVYNKASSFKQQKRLPFETFQEGKSQLIELLKGAFKIQLTTIPIYLSAMYSIKHEGQATKLIRSIAKDEMKHLFIVSNLLNAVGENPPYPKPNASTDNNLPTYPLPSQELLCFHFQLKQNEYWKNLMSPLPIQSSIRDQLLRFIMIQMPGEAYEIEITPDYSFISQDDLERRARIGWIKKAIDAVKAEMAAKQQPQGIVGQIKENLGKEDEFLTIGMAYQKIMDYLWALSDMDETRLFNGNNAKQFTYMYLQNMTSILGLRTALEQIRLITQEGEGSSMFTITGEINKASHFVKFIEIFTGCDLNIFSEYKTTQTLAQKDFKRTAQFVFVPNQLRFPNFPNYTTVIWDKETDKKVDLAVNSELRQERLSDNLRFTQFPNTYAPRSFLNNYVKILQELGFIFTTDPSKFVSDQGLTFEATRLKCMENTIAKMRQMSLNATHIVHPNDTFDRKFHTQSSDTKPNYPQNPINSKIYPSSSPKYNLDESKWLPEPDDKN